MILLLLRGPKTVVTLTAYTAMHVGHMLLQCAVLTRPPLPLPN